MTGPDTAPLPGGPREWKQAVAGARITAERKLGRIGYFLRHLAGAALPARRLRDALTAAVRNLSPADATDVAKRVNYYNKLAGPVLPPADPSTRISAVAPRFSMYALDFREAARLFDPELRVPRRFGDVNIFLEEPTVVKSRPLGAGDENSILLNLDKFRHFFFPADPFTFAEKRGVAVWRGVTSTAARQSLVRRHFGHPLCDVGFSRNPREQEHARPFMPIGRQLGYRYVVSAEGYDVATNLKWILGSNSLCLMPRPRFETWFMEGRLEPGVHFVQLEDDLADLADKVAFLERRPAIAERIVRNARSFAAQFRDKTRERLIAALVLQKYFELSGQSNPGPWSRLFHSAP